MTINAVSKCHVPIIIGTTFSYYFIAILIREKTPGQAGGDSGEYLSFCYTSIKEHFIAMIHPRYHAR
jgi:hypothetical protein